MSARAARARTFALAIVVACVWALWASPALAVDPRAEAGAKDAIRRTGADFAASDYATAVARLDKALRSCAGNRCTPGTKAFVLRDLGTMQFRMGDKDAASNSFTQALGLDRDIDLSSKYEAPDLRAAWNRAKELANEMGGPPPEQPVGGDFSHTPAAEQKVNTPLPVYVEFPGDSPPKRVVVKYKGARMKEWKQLDLAKVGDGWGGVIPCGRVSRGAMLYWVQGFDDSGEPAAASGDPKHPFTVPIRAQIGGDAPHLPDKPAPHTCTPGSKGGGGDEGDSGTDGDSGEAEGEGGPVAAPHGYARLWVGAAFSFEFLSMPSGKDVCKLNGAGLPANPSNMYCTNPDGSDFPSRSQPAGPMANNALVPGQSGQSAGGLQLGDVRILLSVDYALTPNLLVGGRIGYVANSYPGDAASRDGRAAGFKIHVEGRAPDILGADPLLKIGFLPMGFAGLGLGEFDANATSVIRRSDVMGQQPVNVWITDGPVFVFFGGGVRYQFSQRLAATGAVRLNLAFGGNGLLPTFGPEFGVVYGF